MSIGPREHKDTGPHCFSVTRFKQNGANFSAAADDSTRGSTMRGAPVSRQGARLKRVPSPGNDAWSRSFLNFRSRPPRASGTAAEWPAPSTKRRSALNQGTK